MLLKRIIPCLDIRDGRVVKGVGFQGLRDAGDPLELAAAYGEQGADELCFLDITATHEGRRTVLELVSRVAERVFVPLTVGGGVRTLDDMKRLLEVGADKVSVGSAAVHDPGLIERAAERFGRQFVVVSIDASPAGGGRYVVTWRGGRELTDLDALEYAREAARRGAGELLLNVMDRDGTRQGFHLELTRAVSRAVDVPVIASGGAGELQHFADVLTVGEADAALAASVFHYGQTTLGALKAYLNAHGVPVRARPDAMA